MRSTAANRKALFVIVLVTLAAVTSGVVTWRVGRDYDERRSADQMRSLGLGVRPTLLWTLDVDRLTDGPGEVLRSFPSLTSGNVGGGLAESSTHLIAAVGRARDSSTSLDPSDVTLVGIDPADGSPDWRRAIGAVSECSTEPITDAIACWSESRVTIVDTATGRVMSESTPDFDVADVQLFDGRAYISGTRGRGTSTRAVIAAGPVGAPTSSFTRTIAVPGTAAAVGEVVPGRDLAVVDAVSAEPESTAPSTVYSLGTGAAVFTVDGPARAAGEKLFRVESYAQRTERLIGADGSTVRSQSLTLAGGSLQPVVVSAPFVPVVMGDGVFDPNTGGLLWRDPVVDWGRRDGGIAPAIIGTMVVAASLDGNLIGMDARTGRRAWTTQWPGAFSVRSGVTDGRLFVFGDVTGMHSIDTVTGRVLWDVYSPGADGDRYTSISDSGGDIVRATGTSISVWRARKQVGPDETCMTQGERDAPPTCVPSVGPPPQSGPQPIVISGLLEEGGG